MKATTRVNRPNEISVPVTSSMTVPMPIRLRSSCWPGAAPGGNPNSLTGHERETAHRRRYAAQQAGRVRGGGAVSNGSWDFPCREAVILGSMLKSYKPRAIECDLFHAAPTKRRVWLALFVKPISN